ncbi:MAG TPA: ATP-binding protein [Thermoanaerobaculia bacterium]|jgi:ATP-dependent DNA helicase RecG|nr:ATP-binding protein [Thermoanaerobaculia bacterium]
MSSTSILPLSLDLLLTFESARIELKASWDEKTTGSQVLRTIAAFANDFQNLNGGYVVIGVEAPNGVPILPPRGLDPGQLEAIQRWIRGQCKRIEPDYQPILSPETKDGRHLLVIWVPPSDTRPHTVPETLDKGAPRSYYVRLGGETTKASGDILHQLISLSARIPFDDRRALGVSLEKIRSQMVREFLSAVQSDLLNEPDARETYRRLRLSAPVNGHEVPKNIALLFFSDDPEEWFPGSRIEVVEFADGAAGNLIEEHVFRGSLDRQLRDALRYLAGLSTQHIEKVDDRPETRGWASFPVPALEESLANAIYHRSYDSLPEPTKVYLYPDRMEVISYPGPVYGIDAKHLEPGGKVPPVPARNRRIGELLKELRLAEARGTGIPKVFRAMQQNGSPPPIFDFDAERTYFRVTLPAHPEFVGRTRGRRDRRV